MIARVLMAAILAGLAAGVVVTAIQQVTVVPLILEAEVYETGGPAKHDHGPGHGSAGESEAAGQDDATDQHFANASPLTVERIGFTLLFNLLTSIAFALLLAAAVTLSGQRASLARGALWGAGGFAVFALAPALGLPPELPGMPTADLLDRQVWWAMAAAGTAAGLGLMVFGRGFALRLLGLVLLAAPQAVAAPRPADLASAVPASLAAEFASASLATSAVFWVLLGLAVMGVLARDQPQEPA